MKRQQEPVEKWKPTSSNANDLREGMKSFAAKLINGKMQYPFEQYCVSKGIISLMSNGQIEIRNPETWRQALKAWDLMKWQDNKDMEKLFVAYPEEREAYETKLEGFKQQIRSVFGSKRVIPT